MREKQGKKIDENIIEEYKAWKNKPLRKKRTDRVQGRKIRKM